MKESPTIHEFSYPVGRTLLYFLKFQNLFLLVQLVSKTEGTVTFTTLKLRLRPWPFHDVCPRTTRIYKCGHEDPDHMCPLQWSPPV